jgi:hypothetical protein
MQLLKLHFLSACTIKASAPCLSAAPPRTLRCLNSSTQHRHDVAHRLVWPTRHAAELCPECCHAQHKRHARPCAVCHHAHHDASSHSAWHKHNNPRSMPMRRVGTSGGRAFLTSCIGESAGPTAPALDLLMQRQHRVCKWQKPLRSKTRELEIAKDSTFCNILLTSLQWIST